MISKRQNLPLNIKSRDDGERFNISDEELAEISLILNLRRSFVLSHYKESYIKRRISVRMHHCAVEDAAEYCSILRADEEEIELLEKCITIHVSQFYRNPSMFDLLQKQILPAFFSRSSAKVEPKVIYSIGCATGEEPYSIAMLLKYYFAKDIARDEVKIVGCDIDTESLNYAKKGCYPIERLKTLPLELLKTFFKPVGEKMQLSLDIKSIVNFVELNISNAEIYEASDIILCRNTLIYFNRHDQEKILDVVTNSLKPNGVLILGKSETLTGKIRREYQAISLEERIYRKTGGVDGDKNTYRI